MAIAMNELVQIELAKFSQVVFWGLLGEKGAFAKALVACSLCSCLPHSRTSHLGLHQRGFELGPSCQGSGSQVHSLSLAVLQALALRRTALHGNWGLVTSLGVCLRVPVSS